MGSSTHYALVRSCALQARERVKREAYVAEALAPEPGRLLRRTALAHLQTMEGGLAR